MKLGLLNNVGERYQLWIEEMVIRVITSLVGLSSSQAHQIRIESLSDFYNSALFRNNNFSYDAKRKLIIEHL